MKRLFRPRPTTTRARTTRRHVYVIDAVANAVVTCGGMGVVVAVFGICVYLALVVVKLFVPGHAALHLERRVEVESAPLFVQPDEHSTAALMVGEDGELRAFKLESGAGVSRERIVPEGRRITAVSRAPRNGHTAFGYDDGTFQIGQVEFRYEFLLDDEAATDLGDLEPGGVRDYRGGVAQRTPIGQFRVTRAVADLTPPASFRSGGGAVRRIAYQVNVSQEFVAAVLDDGTAVFNRVRKTVPLGGGPPRLRLTESVIEYAPPAGQERAPRWLFVTGDGGSVLFLWPDGTCQRYGVFDDGVSLVETVRLTDEGRTLTSAATLIGGRTLVLGDDAGNVYGCFAARDPATTNRDKHRLVRAHALEALGAPIVDIGPSERDRTLTTMDDRGVVAVRNMTSHALVTRFDSSGVGRVREVALLPKVDGVLVMGEDGRYALWELDPGHPDATIASLFGRVWYEGESAPAHVYQSSSGDDAAEAKYGLTPLIWGTFKATVFTMIFAAPLAILAAVFTSEFLGARVRGVVKPTIETMASLPSVVLGFIAAMLIAPHAAEHLPGVLLAFVAAPIGALLGAHLWQFASQRALSRTSNGARLAMIAAVAGASCWVAIGVGPRVERALFAPSAADLLSLAGSHEEVPEGERPSWVGAREALTASQSRALRAEGMYFRDGRVVRPVGSVDEPSVREAIERAGLDRPSLRAWLNGVYGGAWPGWFVLAFPGALIVIVLVVARRFDASIREWTDRRAPVWTPLADLLRFGASLGASVGLAALAASALTSIGLDPRDSIFGTFEQRNTLVVALAMSVAVIPIIYTICDDAMTSVPDSLRSASLAAGATRWQTAVRIVLPVAMSGVFSACMIGLGRAAGETMIVLMATGNTPVMSASVFDGMRTLSANIAVELPEAPKDETHYRVLFLCGLVLFIVTFTVNTVAEIVRQRFRKRSAAL